RLLERALHQRAATVRARFAGLRFTAGQRGHEQIVTNRAQAVVVDEAAHGELADFSRVGFTRHLHGDLAVRRDRDLRRALGDGDRGIERQAVVVHDAPRAVNLELAVAGVGERAVILEHGQKAVALDGDVELIVGLAERALGELARGADDAN